MQEYLGIDKPVNKLEPLVSVCLVTYNHKQFITQCLESIIIQKTKFPFELIIGEDDSKDGTREMCINYAEKYPDKIRLFLRKEEDKIWIDGNKTGRFNFIENLKTARGKYIALCEGDDYWIDPLKLQKQVEFLEENEDFVLTFSNLKIVKDGQIISDAYIDHNDKRSFQVFHKPPEVFDIYHLAKGNIIHTPVVLFRNYLKNGSIPLYLYDTPIGDWPLYMYVAKFGKIKYQEIITGAYRITNSGIYSSSTKIRRMEMSLFQYPFMINENIFDKSIIKYWKKILPEKIKYYIEITNKSNINQAEKLIQVYAKYVPEILYNSFLLLIKDNKSLLKEKQNIDSSKIFRMVKYITKLKNVLFIRFFSKKYK